LAPSAGLFSLVGGGEMNTVNANYAVIGGGKGNQVIANYGTILVRGLPCFSSVRML
jgi:hypothetical protein